MNSVMVTATTSAAPSISATKWRASAVLRRRLPAASGRSSHVCRQRDPIGGGRGRRANRVAAPSDIERKLRNQRTNALGTSTLPLRSHQTQVSAPAGDWIYLVQASLLSRRQWHRSGTGYRSSEAELSAVRKLKVIR
jgi:hypothetical protein